jgi:hypothetical protein
MRLLPIGLAAAAGVAMVGLTAPAARPETATTLKSASEFASIADRKERAVSLFVEAGRVLQHPRCLNCHPAGDRPTQGENGHPHEPLVVRGLDGLGAIGMRCTTCHGPANFGAVPGHPLWHLAPVEMAWAGKSLGAICEQIKDPKRNGGKPLTKIVAHMTTDSLVGWGWNPGNTREPAPGSQQAFGDLIRAWADNGAHCPAE